MDFVVVNKRKKSFNTIEKSSREKKSSIKDLVCTICDAPAIGFNFSVITCMCCKAFFRRNALYGLESLQCRYLSENCLINIKTRRDCSYCRLKKCFQAGMKKELILTEELKVSKREKILANRQMTLNTVRPITTLMIHEKTPLQNIDTTYLNNIYNAYEEYCRSPIILYEKSEFDLVSHQPIKNRVKMQHYIEHYQKSQSFLVNFFQRIPEYKQLTDDQQIQLTKNNMRFVIRISLIETISDQLPLWPAIHLLLETIFGKLILEKTAIILYKFKDEISDSICIRLVLIILYFSTNNSSYTEKDALKIFKIQEKYIELLWSYLKQRYSELIACEKISIIVRHCLHIQTIGHIADLKRQDMERTLSISWK